MKMKTAIRDFRVALGMLLLSLLLSGCSRSKSAATQEAPSRPARSDVSRPSAAAPTAASTSASPRAGIPAGTATPVAPGSGQSAAPQATLPPPASSDVSPFNPAALIAAFAALPGSAPTQADAVAFALFSARDFSTVHNVAKDFANDFAAHRNADRYLQLLKSSAKAIGGLLSEDFYADLGPYDFNRKSFSIVIGNRYKDMEALSGTSIMNAYVPPGQGEFPSPVMPDGSALMGGPDQYQVELHFGDGNRLSAAYPLDPDRAEVFGNASQHGQFWLAEHIVFYPVAISRRSHGRLVAVVHVTKVILEQRPNGAPMSTVPTILMSTDLQ
jgi:hypothetical protein